MTNTLALHIIRLRHAAALHMCGRAMAEAERRADPQCIALVDTGDIVITHGWRAAQRPGAVGDHGTHRRLDIRRQLAGRVGSCLGACLWRAPDRAGRRLWRFVRPRRGRSHLRVGGLQHIRPAASEAFMNADCDKTAQGSPPHE